MAEEPKPPEVTPDDGLIRALSHPLRARLLGMLDGRVASPSILAKELGLPLGRVSYHIRLLSDLDAIELVRTEPRRGALEHFYRAMVRTHAADWVSRGIRAVVYTFTCVDGPNEGQETVLELAPTDPIGPFLLPEGSHTLVITTKFEASEEPMPPIVDPGEA